MRALRVVVPILALGSLLVISSAPAYAGGVPSAVQQFVRCVRAHQGGEHHPATLAEAKACAPTSRQITSAEFGSLTAGSTAILVRADGSAALVGESYSPIPAALTAGTCYNTWANPMPWGTSGIDFVQINVHGYGNHCGYADVPTTPSVNATCYVPWCFATIHAGHYDSNQGLSWFNDRRAAGWANIYFNIGDTWFCRGYVDTNGNPNSPQWCS
jgi:hypothetical protein